MLWMQLKSCISHVFSKRCRCSCIFVNIEEQAIKIERELEKALLIDDGLMGDERFQLEIERNTLLQQCVAPMILFCCVYTLDMMWWLTNS